MKHAQYLSLHFPYTNGGKNGYLPEVSLDTKNCLLLHIVDNLQLTLQDDLFLHVLSHEVILDPSS